MIQLFEYSTDYDSSKVYILNFNTLPPVGLRNAIKITDTRFLVVLYLKQSPWVNHLYDYAVDTNTYKFVAEISYGGFELYLTNDNKVIIARLAYGEKGGYGLYNIDSQTYINFNIHNTKPWSFTFKSEKIKNNHLLLGVNSGSQTNNSFLEVIEPNTGAVITNYDIGSRNTIQYVTALSDTRLIYFILTNVNGLGNIYFVDTKKETKNSVEFNPGNMLYSVSKWIIPIHDNLIIYVKQDKNTIKLLTGAFDSVNLTVQKEIQNIDRPSVFLDGTSLILVDRYKQVIVLEDFINKLGTSLVTKYNVKTETKNLIPFSLVEKGGL